MKPTFETTALGCALAIAALVLTGCPSHTQPEAPSWTYDLSVDAVPGRAYPAADGGYLVVGMIDRDSVYGSSGDKSLFLTPYLMCLSATGEMLWKTPLDSRGTPVSTMTPDGHILAAVLRAASSTTNETRLLTIAPDGAITRDVACRSLSSDRLYPQCMASTGDGGCIVAGRLGLYNSQNSVVRFDAQGQPLWERRFPSDIADTRILDVAWLGASGFAIIGLRDGALARVMRYDCEGTLRWWKYYGDVCWEDRIYIAPGPGGDVYIGGARYNARQTGTALSLRRVDGDGNDLSTVLYDLNPPSPPRHDSSSFPSPEIFCTIHGMAADSQGGVFVIGESAKPVGLIPILDCPTINSGFVLHYASDGTLDMERNIGRDTRLGSITALPPGGYIGVGQRDGKLLISRGELDE